MNRQLGELYGETNRQSMDFLATERERERDINVGFVFLGGEGVQGFYDF